MCLAKSETSASHPDSIPNMNVCFKIWQFNQCLTGPLAMSVDVELLDLLADLGHRSWRAGSGQLLDGRRGPTMAALKWPNDHF